MKAYIFYNGDDVSLPDESRESNWGGYVNPDSAKMFAVCADSWESNGWEVERLECRFQPWNGRLAHSSYPYNGLIPAIVRCDMHLGGLFMVTTDVINQGYAPFAVEPCGYARIPFAHPTLAAGWFSEQWFIDALAILESYDSGLLRDVTEHTDESVLRANMSLQKYCRPTESLKHYSRSLMRRELTKRSINCLCPDLLDKSSIL